MNSSVTTIDETRPFLPIRLLNGCGALLEKIRIARTKLVAIDLIEAAKRRCGLEDFGQGNFADGLSRLLESCHSESRLNLIGKIALRSERSLSEAI